MKNIPTAGSEFSQFLLFFEKLSVENKTYIIQVLSETAKPKKQDGKTWESLKGSVLAYSEPFEPVAVEDWEVLA